MKTWLLVSVLCLAAVAYGRRYQYEHEDLDDEMMGDEGKSGPGILQNWDADCAKMINNLIHTEIETTFQYIAIATFFRRHDVDIIGMSLMFNAWARMKINLAKDMMMYLVKRGAGVEFKDVKKPSETQWADPGAALSVALRTEKGIADKVNELAKHAANHNDYHLLGYIEEKLTNTQADNVFEVAALINKLSRGGNKFGLMSINQQMVKKYKDYVDCESDTEKYKWNY
ncbi:ferritin light chain, oocyte isoform-like [Liolophura sinensis]|uniref:ferritin light chain, oocyte isoform-like n=1 Tax=Liolophura sinensis TaxID=3198878 RepID=UPI0031595E40